MKTEFAAACVAFGLLLGPVAGYAADKKDKPDTVVVRHTVYVGKAPAINFGNAIVFDDGRQHGLPVSGMGLRGCCPNSLRVLPQLHADENQRRQNGKTADKTSKIGKVGKRHENPLFVPLRTSRKLSMGLWMSMNFPVTAGRRLDRLWATGATRANG